MSSQAPYLLTPGPLTTSASVKQAMLKDWGSWDSEFNAMTAEICQQLLAVAGAERTHVCVPVQGSGTFAVEAVLGTLIAPESYTLVLMNGAYGQRVGEILEYLQRPYLALDKGDYEPPRGVEVAKILALHPDIEQVVLIHCETSSGILNPLEEIAAVCAEAGVRLILDSMSAFGAVPVNMAELPCAALISSANKCFEGVPGFAFALIERQWLEGTQGRCHSLSLDLYEQWRHMEQSGKWRYTPPTHVIAAFLQALKEHQAEGGVQGRLARYTANRDRLVAGMRAMGFQTLLADEWLSPIITTFLSPQNTAFDFAQFYAEIKHQGFVIYPGKLTVADSFRIGCIGQLFDEQIDAVLQAVSHACSQMGLALPVSAPTLISSQLKTA